MPSLPLILAGPLLRRSSERRVCVWFATREAVEFRLEIVNTQQQVLGQSHAWQSQSIQLGKHLWVCLLQASSIDDTFYPKDELLFYRVFNQAESKYLDLSSSLLDGFEMPSFFIPSELQVFAQGSCRKPHGLAATEEGDKPGIDTLSLLAGELNRTANDLKKRPSILTLTGDQIYADDVHESVLAMVQQQARELMGEDLGVPQIDRPCDIPLNQRKRVIDQLRSGISSSARDNHLITFGEFAAMYVYVFGNQTQWHVTDNDDVRGFHQNLHKIQKVFANIPTYMIFDDHEITDDWNLTRSWYESVRYSPCGRRIISNGLAAYWAFQGWGNNPERFDNEFVETVQTHLRQPKDEACGERFDLQMWKHRGWGYSIPSSPPVIVMDTRTQRDFDGRDTPAILMDRYALDWLRMEWMKLKARGATRQPIIVSPKPVFAFDPMVKVKLTARFFRVKCEDLDLEAWIGNRKGYTYLLDTLLLRMKLSKLTILSGDVHYSYANQASYFSAGKRLDCLQLTCSPIKNTPNVKKFLNWLALLTDHKEHKKGWRVTQRTPWYKLAWLRLINNDALHPIWRAQIQGVRAKGKNRLVTPQSNFGLVELEQGQTKRFVLVHSDSMNQRTVFEFD
ncbi:MAG: alkaline phosphatase D family protein [Gammaproteobacteria bacterium]|nr:alkaline phosphatase D family protein [Gammaproteobacteria bacterium]MDH5728400.1 alkaline phosphatase D family protein [Gammaproteobacteria bacterium]